MILFDPDQPEAANGFPKLAKSQASGTSRAALPTKPTLTRYLRQAQSGVGLKGEVSVLLTNDAGIRRLNRRFRNKNKATDVLSFPMDDPGSGHAGDLAISVQTAARQAAEQKHSLSIELRVLMLHGLLHLAGHDHEADMGEMANLERQLRAQLHLPSGLIERAGEAAPAGKQDRALMTARKRTAPTGSRKTVPPESHGPRESSGPPESSGPEGLVPLRSFTR